MSVGIFALIENDRLGWIIFEAELKVKQENKIKLENNIKLDKLYDKINERMFLNKLLRPKFIGVIVDIIINYICAF